MCCEGDLPAAAHASTQNATNLWPGQSTGAGFRLRVLKVVWIPGTQSQKSFPSLWFPKGGKNFWDTLYDKLAYSFLSHSPGIRVDKCISKLMDI
jgi:hypothetical protein